MHAEFSSADASALTEPNGRAVLYGAGSVLAISLGANDVVSITDIVVTLGATGRIVTIYDGADATADAGEVIWKGTLAANGTADIHFQSPHVCQKGTWPKVLTSGAGQVDVTLHGKLARVGS